MRLLRSANLILENTQVCCVVLAATPACRGRPSGSPAAKQQASDNCRHCWRRIHAHVPMYTYMYIHINIYIYTYVYKSQLCNATPLFQPSTTDQSSLELHGSKGFGRPRPNHGSLFCCILCSGPTPSRAHSCLRGQDLAQPLEGLLQREFVAHGLPLLAGDRHKPTPASLLSSNHTASPCSKLEVARERHA